MPLVYLLRRFQVLKVDLDIHQGSIRRNETTASTKEIIDQDDDVSVVPLILLIEGEVSKLRINFLFRFFVSFSPFMFMCGFHNLTDLFLNVTNNA